MVNRGQRHRMTSAAESAAAISAFGGMEPSVHRAPAATESAVIRPLSGRERSMSAMSVCTKLRR